MWNTQTSRSGDLDLPDDLDRQFRRPLMVFFLRRVGGEAEAEDLTQEVFLRLLKRRSDPDFENNANYVFQIAANLLRDRARKTHTHHARQHVSLEDGEIAQSSALIEDRGPERVLLGEEALTEVLLALNELDERTRDVFFLHRVEKMKHREIAKLYGISVSMVEKLVMQAKAHLVCRFGNP